MLAHGVGLGIHNPSGCIQMLENKNSWNSIGYEIKAGTLKKDEPTAICRLPENSPNRIREIYQGKKNLVEVQRFDDRAAELAWVAQSIKEDIQSEGVRPEQIVVISLDKVNSKQYLLQIQANLRHDDIASTIPGLVDQSWEFAEPGLVTLSTVYRAKGNEAPVIYIVSFETLYSYAEEVESRNRAFTSMSRSKGWLRISGVGKQMDAVVSEIGEIAHDIPCFNFNFPDMEKIRRRLDSSETSRRKTEVKKAKKSLYALLEIDEGALGDLDKKLIKKLKKKLEEASDED